MKLSEWAKKEGIHYKTAWKWWKQGTLPVPARQAAPARRVRPAPRSSNRRLRETDADVSRNGFDVPSGQ